MTSKKRMLSTESGQVSADRGPLVTGVPIKADKSRRIGRAREKEADQRKKDEDR